MKNKIAFMFLIIFFSYLQVIANALPDFTDVTEQSGVGDDGRSLCVSFVDYDNDDNLDIFVSNENKPALLYRNNDETFINVAKEIGLENENIGEDTWAELGGVFGDFNNDGHLDLYSVIDCMPNPDVPPCFNILYQNDGNNNFIDVTAKARVQGDALGPGNSAIWGDYNNDGYLDLYLVVLGNNNILYRNNGDGTFTDVTTQAGGVEGGKECQSSGITAVFFDFDNDNDLDLYAINGYGPPSFFYQNNDGTFKDITNKAEIGEPGDPSGAAIGDYDNDGYIDIYVVNYFLPNVLYKNLGDGTFEDVAKEAGVDFEAAGMSASFLDYDNDGYLDIYLVNKGPNILFHNEGNGSFEDVTEQANVVSPLGGASCAVGDYNRDGFLDIYVANSGPVGAKKGEPNQLYRNNGNENNWLHLDIKSIKSHIDAIGTRVELIADGMSQIREVGGGLGIYQDSLSVEFGLGSALKAEKIIIRWQNGNIKTLENVSANQFLTITDEEDGPSSIQPKLKLITTLGKIKHSALLLQNFPNPFNPETWIPFYLNVSSRVKIVINDTKGQAIRIIDCGFLEKGEYVEKNKAAFWNGRDFNGEKVSSGLYFYTLKAGEFKSTRKMILVK